MTPWHFYTIPTHPIPFFQTCLCMSCLLYDFSLLHYWCGSYVQDCRVNSIGSIVHVGAHEGWVMLWVVCIMDTCKCLLFPIMSCSEWLALYCPRQLPTPAQVPTFWGPPCNHPPCKILCVVIHSLWLTVCIAAELTCIHSCDHFDDLSDAITSGSKVCTHWL